MCQTTTEKKPVINLLSMQSVGFEQPLTKFIEILISTIIISLQEKIHSGNHLSDHH